MTATGLGSAPLVAAQPSLPREVDVLIVVGGCVMLVLGPVLPVLGVYAATFGAGPTQIGALVAMFALMRLATSPFCGRLGVRFGERRVLVAGLLLCAVSSALTAFAGFYGQLLVFRSLGGVGSVLSRYPHWRRAGECSGRLRRRRRAAGRLRGVVDVDNCSANTKELIDESASRPA
ncbi:MFS transporter [Actinomycetes bacterium KLBMP 9797]